MTRSHATVGSVARIPSEVMEKAFQVLRKTPSDPAFELDYVKQESFPWVCLEHRDITKQVVDLWIQVRKMLHPIHLACSDL